VYVGDEDGVKVGEEVGAGVDAFTKEATNATKRARSTVNLSCIFRLYVFRLSDENDL